MWYFFLRSKFSYRLFQIKLRSAQSLYDDFTNSTKNIPHLLNRPYIKIFKTQLRKKNVNFQKWDEKSAYVLYARRRLIFSQIIKDFSVNPDQFKVFYHIVVNRYSINEGALVNTSTVPLTIILYCLFCSGTSRQPVQCKVMVYTKAWIGFPASWARFKDTTWRGTDSIYATQSRECSNI